MTTDLPLISYSPTISNPKLNPNKPTDFYKLPTQGIDALEKIGETNKKTVPAKMLLSLLKGGLNGEKADSKIFVGRSYEDWVNMYNLAHDNAVTPVALEGLKQTPDIKVPEDVRTNMEINADFAKKYHGGQEKVLKEFTEMTAAHGVDTVQMKGVGYSMNYPNPTARFGGDIDVFNYKHGTDPSNPKNNMSFFVDKIAAKAGMVYEDHGYKHSQITHRTMPIENHRSFLNVESAPIAEKMNKYLYKVLNPVKETLPHGTKILVPSKEFNTVFISFHAMQHFVGGGINFHHLADWAVHVKKHGLKVPEEAKGTKFEEFMYAFTNLSNKHLGTNIKVPENKKLENAIFNKMLNPEKVPGFENVPNTKNPIKILQYKLNRLKASQASKCEFWGTKPESTAKIILKSIKAHFKKPETFLHLFKLVK